MSVLVSVEWGVHVVPGEPTTHCVSSCESPPGPELPQLVVVAFGRGSRAFALSGDGRVAAGARAVRARPVGMYAIPAPKFADHATLEPVGCPPVDARGGMSLTRQILLSLPVGWWSLTRLVVNEPA